MTLKDSLLPVIDLVRGKVPGALGMRPHTVTVRVRTWSGARTGLGTKTDVDTVIANAGGYAPRVEEVSTRDIVASGGLYAQGDYRVGPITPDYSGGGVLATTVDPATTSTAREVLFKLEGPGFPTGGAWCKRVEKSEGVKPFRFSIVLRRMAATP